MWKVSNNGYEKPDNIQWHLAIGQEWLLAEYNEGFTISLVKTRTRISELKND